MIPTFFGCPAGSIGSPPLGLRGYLVPLFERRSNKGISVKNLAFETEREESPVSRLAGSAGSAGSAGLASGRKTGDFVSFGQHNANGEGTQAYLSPPLDGR